MSETTIFQFPYGTFLMERLEFVLITADKLEAKILRVIEIEMIRAKQRWQDRVALAIESVPACSSCNMQKQDMHPSMLHPQLDISQSLPRVLDYLEQRRTEHLPISGHLQITKKGEKGGTTYGNE